HATVTAESTTYSDTSLAPATTYSYEVSAVDLAGNESPLSAPAVATTDSSGDVTPPSIPQNLVAVPISSSRIDLAWSPSTDNVGVTEYVVRRHGETIATVPGTTYSDKELEPSTTYTYTVAARDAAGNESGLSDSAFASTMSAGGDDPVLGSDDFNACGLDLNRWTIVDPRGDGTVAIQGAGTDDAALALTVPAGVGHDLWTTGNFGLRALQSTSDEDFEVAVKFTSPVTLRNQIQGIIVQAE